MQEEQITEIISIKSHISPRYHGEVQLGLTRGTPTQYSLTILRPATELFKFWRDFENLPFFMKNVRAVECINELESHWVIRGPMDSSVEWDAIVTAEEKDRMIAWQTHEDSQVAVAGVIFFDPAPGHRGTEVRVRLTYNPPAGKIGSTLSKIFGASPEEEMKEDMRRFKQLMEAREIATVEGQTSGRPL